MAGEESQERLAKAPMPKGPVVVAQVATLQEADVIRTVLATEPPVLKVVLRFLRDRLIAPLAPRVRPKTQLARRQA